MAASLILVSVSPGEQRTALWRDERLDAAFIERPFDPEGLDDLHVGRLAARAPAMAGAFVALAGGATGFLPDSDGARGRSEGEWLRVRIARAAQGGKGPRLAVAPGDVVTGPLRRLAAGPDAPLRLAQAFPELPVRVDHAATAARLRGVLGRQRVELVRSSAFEEAVEEEFSLLGAQEVLLPGGGRLTLHPTPALLAIDIDAGHQAGGRDAAAHRALNARALAEVARQIRLRHAAGAILIDMAGLTAARRRDLLPGFAEALRADPLARLVGLTGLGLLEVQRRRVRRPLHEILGLPPSPLSRGLAALRRGLRTAHQQPGVRLMLTAPPSVLGALRQAGDTLQIFAAEAGSLELCPDPLCPAGEEHIHAR
jgi:Ribonuclease G/E